MPRPAPPASRWRPCRSAPAPRPPAPPAEAPAEAPQIVREVPVPANGTLLIDKPLRSGQQVYARGGDVVVTAVVSFGAEVIADGNVHVYAPLRGKAIAGARGNTEARIFSTCMEAQLVAIAGIYRTNEVPLPPGAGQVGPGAAGRQENRDRRDRLTSRNAAT
jgi:septum site-determining protein MinC